MGLSGLDLRRLDLMDFFRLPESFGALALASFAIVLATPWMVARIKLRAYFGAISSRIFWTSFVPVMLNPFSVEITAQHPARLPSPGTSHACSPVEYNGYCGQCPAR